MMMWAKVICSMFKLPKPKIGFILSFTVALSAGFNAPVAAQDMQMECNSTLIADAKEIICDFRLSEPQPLEELVLSANDTVLDGSVFTPYSGTGSTSALLFLIDTSNPRRAATVKRNLDIVRDQLRFASASRLVGLATFANNLELIYEPKEIHSSVESKLNDIVANGAATEFFANSLEAIKILKNVQADRRALIIMSDGKAEDTAYTRTDVVAAAKDAGVVIIGLGFAESQSETPALQEIRRLAEDTSGYFDSVVGAQPFQEDLLKNLPRYIENGGKVTAPLQGISGTVNATLVAKLSNGNSLSASSNLEIETSKPLPEPKEPSLIVNIYSIFEDLFPGASDWADKNSMLAYVLLALLPLIALAIFFFIQMQNKRVETEAAEIDDEGTEEIEFPDPEEDGETRVFNDAPKVLLGYFEVVGSEDVRYQIPGESVSIGRHSDNDIQLTNDSVHRHHAHFYISPEGVPTIHDLDTTNRVLVNGASIKTVELKPGDIIELGEVRLRYVP